MENTFHEPNLPETLLPAIRHDGWTGEKMATFCEALAESAVVAEACDQAGMGISGAYALRRRNPAFAAAWDAALTIARERLADTLLARSMEGNVEQLYKDGELIGERHLLDNRLGLAILRRLDRLAETGMTVSSRGERFQRSDQSPSILPARQAFDWEMMLNALRTGDPDDVAAAIAQLRGEGDKVEEVEDRSNSLSQGDEGLDLSDRCWKDGIDDWLTDFPPPDGFTGYESCEFGDPAADYERECTDEEKAILDADAAAERAAEQAEDAALRDQWFEFLKSGPRQAEPNSADVE